jgi:hypothetical protein
MRLTTQREESFEKWRQRALEETSRFIEWGLAHPDKVEWIPKHPVGRGQFPERVKAIFWGLIFSRNDGPQ